MRKRAIVSACCWFLVGSAAFAQPRWVDGNKDSSFVTYTLSHPLHTFDATSKDAIFHVLVDPTQRRIDSVEAQVDVMTFDSRNSNRDSHAMEVIDAISYPDVIFSSTKVLQGGDSLTVQGKLTFHGVTRDIVAFATSTWSPERLSVQGNFNLSLTDFNIERPSLLMMPVSDTLRFSLMAVFGFK